MAIKKTSQLAGCLEGIFSLHNLIKLDPMDTRKLGPLGQAVPAGKLAQAGVFF